MPSSLNKLAVARPCKTSRRLLHPLLHWRRVEIWCG